MKSNVPYILWGAMEFPLLAFRVMAISLEDRCAAVGDGGDGIDVDEDGDDGDDGDGDEDGKDQA